MEQEKIEKILANIAKKGSIDAEIVKSAYADLSKGKPTDDNSVKQMLEEIQSQYASGSKAKIQQCIFFGIGRLGDFNKKRFEQALGDYERDARSAIEKGAINLVDGDPVVMDRKEFLDKNNKYPNSNFGKALENSYVCTSVALVKNSEGNFQATNVQLRKACASPNIPEFGKVVEVALIGDFHEGFHTSDSSVFKTIGNVENINTVIASSFPDNVVPMEDLYTNAQDWEPKKPARGSTDSNGYYNRFVITNAKQQSLYPAKREGQSSNGKLRDLMLDSDISCFIDPRIPQPEVDKSYTYVGVTSLKKGYVKETKLNEGPLEVQINIMGIFP